MHKCAKAKEDKKKAKAHTIILTEIKYTYTRKDDVSLQMNTTILEAF